MGLFDRFLGRGPRAAGPPPADEVGVPDSRDATADHATADDRAAADGEVKDRLLFPRAKYQGEFTPENLAFDNNLQEFAQRVAYICSLENSGKITGDDAHSQIRDLYKQLRRSHKGLNIDEQGPGV